MNYQAAPQYHLAPQGPGQMVYQQPYSQNPQFQSPQQPIINTMSSQYQNPNIQNYQPNTQIMYQQNPSQYQNQNSQNYQLPGGQFNQPQTQINQNPQMQILHPAPQTAIFNPQNQIIQPQPQYNQPNLVIVYGSPEEIQQFKEASEAFTYVFGFCALNMFFGILNIVQLIVIILQDPKSFINLPYSYATLVYLVLIIISYILIISGFFVFLSCRKTLRVTGIITSLVKIFVAAVLWIAALFDYLDVLGSIGQCCPEVMSGFIGIWIVCLFSGLIYYILLFVLGGRVAIFLALEMKKENSIASRLMKMKYFKSKVNT